MAELGTSGGAQLSLETERQGARLILALSGELDMTNAGALDAAVEPALTGGAQTVVLDVSGLRFVDSSGIATWLRWAAKVGSLEVRGPSPLLRALIDSMGLCGALRVVS